jgi:hypothetical protein
VFAPVLDPPDGIPPPRFDLGRCGENTGYNVLGCRHGRVLVKDRARAEEVIVCDPITGEQCWLAVPPDLKKVSVNGAVTATADHGHVHGGCHSSPFKVVIVSMHRENTGRLLACVYSSETGLWGGLISSPSPCDISGKPAVLVGNSLYWLSMVGVGILEFDLGENRLAVARGPPVPDTGLFVNRQIIRAEDGAVGYAILYYPSFRMWQRNVDGHGVTTWVPWKTIELDTLGIRRMKYRLGYLEIIRGYDEEADLVFLDVMATVYMLNLKSMQTSELSGTRNYAGLYHPFRSFYTPGNCSSLVLIIL